MHLEILRLPIKNIGETVRYVGLQTCKLTSKGRGALPQKGRKKRHTKEKGPKKNRRLEFGIQSHYSLDPAGQGQKKQKNFFSGQGGLTPSRRQTPHFDRNTGGNVVYKSLTKIKKRLPVKQGSTVSFVNSRTKIKKAYLNMGGGGPRPRGEEKPPSVQNGKRKTDRRFFYGRNRFTGG